MNSGESQPSIAESPPAIEPTAPDISEQGKTCRSKRIVCVIEKLNMVFLIFFVCYLSWTIPANYGLFTSSKSKNNVTGTASDIPIEEMNTTQRKIENALFNFTGFNINAIQRFNQSATGRRYSFKKRKKDKKRKKEKKQEKKLENNDIVNNSINDRSIFNRKLFKKRNKDTSKKKQRRKNKWKNKSDFLEPTTIRQIIERVAEEALSNGGNWDTNNSNGAPIVSLSVGDDDGYFPPTTTTTTKDRKSDVRRKEKVRRPKRPKVTTTRKRQKKRNRRKWSGWGPCSVTCGIGERIRNRKCGMTCKEVESMVCFMPSCAGKNQNSQGTNVNDFYVWESENFIPKPMSVDFIDPDVDNCGKWMECNREAVSKYFDKSDLPSCPCEYPEHLKFNKKIWDSSKKRHFLWMDTDFEEEGIPMYKPQAQYCIRSQLIPGTSTLAAQQCCYDKDMNLITRGKSAGTPNLISPEISPELHQKVDISPWVICKGDWTRYNEIIPPNNIQQCKDNPNDEDLLLEIQLAKDF